MNSESNSKTPKTSSAKPTLYKRVHRANRPILVTAEADEPTMQAPEEALQPATQIAVEERLSVAEAPRRRMPAFFTSIGKESKDTVGADPKAARMTRALRGKDKETGHDSEKAAPAKKPAVTPANVSLAPKRPPSRFKMRYLWGIMIYILVAEYAGNFLTSYMTANHLNTILFQAKAPWGLFTFDSATLLFLALLVVVLIVMARFDLIPRSLGAMTGAPSPRGTSASAPTFGTRGSQPTAKQGIKGSDDDLYQEYRANQRYYQKRDRKR
ncbi:MAG: hypothetical protein ACRDHZ_05720 [Ktedonobacteraceae bacterium]